MPIIELLGCEHANPVFAPSNHVADLDPLSRAVVFGRRFEMVVVQGPY